MKLIPKFRSTISEGTFTTGRMITFWNIEEAKTGGPVQLPMVLRLQTIIVDHRFRWV